MKVLVCGGRDFSDRALVFSTLDRVREKHGDAMTIIHGAASGADRLAEEWAKSREIDYRGFPARWRKHGKAAGPVRNKRMRDFATPDAVIAFPGGRGTQNMCDLMREHGVEPWCVGWPKDAETPAKQGDSA